MLFKATKVHSGQYKRYGDSFYEWEVISDLPEEKVLEKCFSDLAKAEYPKYEEWLKNINGENKRDMGYYFHGYYTFDRVSGCVFDYKFIICHPYTD